MATILQIINADKNLRHFSHVIKVSGLSEKIAEVGPFTLLCPVNLAFGKPGILGAEELVKPLNAQYLINLLSGHIITGKAMFSDFMPGRKFMTIGGIQITASAQNGEVYVNGAKILARNIQGKNGVVHSVDSMVSSLE